MRATSLRVLLLVAVVIGMAVPIGSVAAAPEGPPLVANGSFEAPDLSAWSGAAGASIVRTPEASARGGHSLAVTSSGLPGSGVATTTVRDARVGDQFVTLAVKGTASSIGQVVQAVIADPATGTRVASAPVHLQPWWQTVGVSADVTSARYEVAVEEAPNGGPWSAGTRYLVDVVDATASGPTVVETSGRQLLVDEEPFVMRGFNYGAAPVGSLGLPHTSNDAVSWQTNPEQCVTDANLMQAAGINALRIWPYLDVYDDRARQCLDAFAAAGVGLLYLVNGPQMLERAEPEFLEPFWLTLSNVISQVKDHPATLGYVIGNANGRQRSDAQPGWFAMLDELARRTKELDPVHVATTALGSQMFFGYCRPAGAECWPGVQPDSAPNIDLWGFNHYGTASGYPDDTWQRVIDHDPNRPAWISEFGTDRFRCSHDAGQTTSPSNGYVGCRADESGEAQQPQANWDVAAWRDIAANLSVDDPEGALVGATLFMWSDLWWFSFPIFTGSVTTPVTHEVTGLPRTNAINGRPDGFVRTRFPDQHFSPEWIGVSHVLRPDMPGPRVTSLAYDAMAIEHTGAAGPRVMGAAMASVSACSATVTWSTDVPTTSRVDFGQVVVIQEGNALVADNTIADVVVQTTEPTTSHRVELTGLTPATTYRAHVRGFTDGGRSATAPALEFATGTVPNGTCP